MSKNPSFSHAISLSHYSVSTKWGHRKKKNVGGIALVPQLKGDGSRRKENPVEMGPLQSSMAFMRDQLSAQHGWWQLRAEAVCLRASAKTSIQCIELFSKRGFWQLCRESHLKPIWVCLESGDRYLLQHNLTQGTRQPSPPPFVPATGTHLLEGDTAADQDMWH